MGRPPPTEANMPDFLLLLHQTAKSERSAGGTPDERMAVIREYMAWTDRIRGSGHHKQGEKLTDDFGKGLRAAAGKVAVTDGPYAESKEVVGGFYIIQAKDYAEACRIAETSPHMKYGSGIEVRQIQSFD
jgi:hypothetical protein